MRLKKRKKYSVFDLSTKVRERGWVISAYTMPPNAEEIAIMRIVVKENFSHDMAEILAKDILKACDILEKKVPGPKKPPLKDQEQHHPLC